MIQRLLPALSLIEVSLPKYSRKSSSDMIH